MRTQAPSPAIEARASVVAWAKAKGIPVREDRGWLILEMSNGDPDPVVQLIAEVMKDRD